MHARHGGKLLSLTRFGEGDAEIAQGAIAKNGLLGPVATSTCPAHPGSPE